MSAIITLYFFLIIFFSLIKLPQINNPTINLFKAFLPSWKFFDESCDTPVLLYRLATEEKWKVCFPPPSKKWFHFLYNPQGNLYLAYHSHIQQTLGDLNNADEYMVQHFHHHVSYKICENFVRALSPCSDFQFKISIIHLNDQDPMIIEDILISPILTSELK